MPHLLAPRINPTGGNNPACLNFGADPGPAFLRSGRDARWHLKAADVTAKLLPVRVSERGNMSALQLLGPDQDQSNQLDSGDAVTRKGSCLQGGWKANASPTEASRDCSGRGWTRVPFPCTDPVQRQRRGVSFTERSAFVFWRRGREERTPRFVSGARGANHIKEVPPGLIWAHRRRAWFIGLDLGDK